LNDQLLDELLTARLSGTDHMASTIFTEELRSRCTSPEHDLVAAILEWAISELESKQPRVRQNAVEWIEASNDDIFGFENVCESLMLDPGYVRRVLGPTLKTVKSKGRFVVKRQRVVVPRDPEASHEYVHCRHCNECSARYEVARRERNRSQKRRAA
jgi:hypothetical protein